MITHMLIVTIEVVQSFFISMMQNINLFIKTEKFKETVCIEINMNKAGKEIINHKDGSVAQKKCNNFLKTFSTLKVSKRLLVQMIILMMVEEEHYLETIVESSVEIMEDGINEEWSKTKMMIKIIRITEIMIKMKNNKNKRND